MTKAPKTAPKTALVLHGGAGLIADRPYLQEIAHMRSLAEEGRARLEAGEAALDIVVDLVKGLEASGFYVAGKGAAPNTAGRYELDAAVMNGATREAGAVSALEGFLSPVEAARAVLEKTPHVLLAGEGAVAHLRREVLTAAVAAVDGLGGGLERLAVTVGDHTPERGVGRARLAGESRHAGDGHPRSSPGLVCRSRAGARTIGAPAAANKRTRRAASRSAASTISSIAASHRSSRARFTPMSEWPILARE